MNQTICHQPVTKLLPAVFSYVLIFATSLTWIAPPTSAQLKTSIDPASADPTESPNSSDRDTDSVRSNATEEYELGAIADRLRKDLAYIASDELKGRAVGSDGIMEAADFIADRFSSLGLETKLFDESPFQKFTMPGASQLGSAEDNQLTFSTGDSTIEWELNEDFTPLTLGTNGEFEGSVVFAGYGITSGGDRAGPDYDDYENVDVEGKVVIILRKEPQQNDPNSQFNGTDSSPFAFFSSKALNAAQHKAAAFILVNDSLTTAAKPWSQEQRTELLKQLDQANALKSEFENGGQWDAAQQANWSTKLGDSLKSISGILETAGEQDQLPGINGGGRARGRSIPGFFATRRAVDELLKSVGQKSLSELESEIDRDLTPRSFELPGVVSTGQASIERQEIPVMNVIAELPGSGNLADEYVVIGAHYDHVGLGGRGSLAPGTIAIHNGADDNGSGTVSLLEVASQLKKRLAGKDHRTLLFMAFTGEESGLLGSAHYVRNPRFDLEKTVAMLNMDMVGRVSANKLTVYGTGTAKEFDAQVDELNDRWQFEIAKVPSGFGPSDHSSFYQAAVPVFHFFSGFHSDYHRPGDDPEKINYNAMARIAGYVTDLALDISTAEQRPTYVNERANRSRGRPTLGVQLNTQGGKIEISRVTPNSAADKAGLLAGDKFVKIGTTDITTLRDLRASLTNAKAGEKVVVIINRAGEDKKIEVQLEG